VNTNREQRAIRKQAKSFVRGIEKAIDEARTAKHCDQCEALLINGVFCHETGCPNSRKTWIEDRGEWVLFVDCFECGYPVELGTACDCQNSDETEAN
jgi:hypothetical protein